MTRFLKYLLLAMAIFAMVWVLVMRFTSNQVILIGAAASVSVAVIFAVRNSLDKIPLYRAFLIIISLAMLTIPALGPREQDSFEKRKLAEFPKFRISNIWKFLFEYDNYFSDRFTFRNDAVEFYGRTKLKLFNTSPLPDIVAIGKDDWLFQSSDTYVGNTSAPWTEQQLDTIITNLKMITRYFDLRGIKYYFAMIPVKERIYPEKMPPNLRFKMQYSRAEALMQALRNHPDVRSVESRDSLIAGKKTRRIYYKTDTHWNEFGAFIGYRCIMNRVTKDFPELLPLSINDFKLDSGLAYSGDLQVLMGMPHEWEEIKYDLKNISGLKLKVADSSMYHTKAVQYNVVELIQKHNGKKLFLIRDSFSQNMRKYIQRNFDRSVLAWTPLVPVTNIVKESPDVVVHEMLEMFSSNLLILPPEIASDTTFLKTNFPNYLK